MWTPLPGREFPGDVDAVRDADPPVSCDPPTLEEIRRAVSQLKSGKAPGGWGIYAEMLKAGGPLLFCGCTLCCVPFGTRGSFRPTGDGALSSRSGRERVTPRSVTTTGGLPSSLYQARSWHEFSSIESAKSCSLTSAMSSLVSHPRSLPLIAFWHSVSSPSVCVISALGCWQPMWISARRSTQ